MAEAYRRRELEWKAGALVSVPIHWSRRWERGFNQSDLLAEALGRHLKLPVLPALQRVRKTPPQVGLEATDRRRNLRGGFSVLTPAAVKGRRIVLLDDVRTTGSTLSECGLALRAAGAAAVFGLTVTYDR
jgi:ComF family protein